MCPRSFALLKATKRYAKPLFTPIGKLVQPKKKHMLLLICVIIGSIITITAAIIDYRIKLSEKDEELQIEKKRTGEFEKIIEKSNSILEKNNSILQTQHEVIESSSKIISLQDELNQKNIKIQKLQGETLQNLTGGDGVPKLKIVSNGVTINVNVENDQNYPIRNVEIVIERAVFDGFVDSPDGNGRIGTDVNNLDTTIKVDDIQNKTTKTIYSDRYKKEFKEFYYVFRVKWQNGFYIAGFHNDSAKGKSSIYDIAITNYSDNLDLADAFSVNLVLGELGLFQNNAQPIIE